MPLQLAIEFQRFDATPPATTVVMAAKGFELGSHGKHLDKQTDGQITRAAKAAQFEGQAKRQIEILAPNGLECDRLVIAGIGDHHENTSTDWLRVGGQVAGRLAAAKTTVGAVIVDHKGDDLAETAADIAMGCLLRNYAFDKYKTKAASNDDKAENGETTEKTKLKKIVVMTKDPAAAEEAFAARRAVADGVALARDLVNEPANKLGPIEFAQKCSELAELGLEIDVMEPERLEDLGMRALLGVAQGSARPARVVVMSWHGAKSKRSKPLCFIGKGVVFDTGGISIKPASGMEDMKGDMGGAACVTGLMAALAGRKAPVNAIGIVGLVENMPSATAQRPGDIVESMSGQTIEVINTDAEGRLVLADLLHHAREEFNPRFMINLATLTGAIIVALGKEYAGMFSNDDKLSSELSDAGEATGEKVWRMPLDRAYDDMINTPNADMKNVGGRNAGSITAAQFLKRFVGDTPWVHLDVAGVAMASGKTDISQSWASGWGVRLLDHLVATRYEK